MRAYYSIWSGALHVVDLEEQLASARAEITPPFHVYYMDIGADVEAEDLGNFETAQEVDAAMAADIARRNGIDLDVVKKVQNAQHRYRITAPPF